MSPFCGPSTQKGERLIPKNTLTFCWWFKHLTVTSWGLGGSFKLFTDWFYNPINWRLCPRKINGTGSWFISFWGQTAYFQGVLRIYSLTKPTSGGIPNRRCCYTMSIYTYIHRINHQTVSIPPKKIQVWHQPKQYTCLSAIPSELP